MSIKSRTKLFSPVYAFAIATVTTLVLVPSAAPANTPLITLGPITVLNGTAVLAGSIGSQASGVELTVNGKPLAIDTAGDFAGTVDLNGADAVVLVLSRPATGAVVKLRIPLLGRTVIPGSALDSLIRAGIRVLQPVVKPGQPVTVSGSVADASQLATLTVNGASVMSALQGGTFDVQLPDDTGQVQVDAAAPDGTTETVDTPVFRPFSTSAVSARNAVGLRIAQIRYVRKGVRHTDRLRMIVTVRDARGRLIRGAAIRVAGKGHKLARRPRATHSGQRGRATITLRLRGTAFGRRLVTVTVAKTPHAKARKTTAVRVPSRH